MTTEAFKWHKIEYGTWVANVPGGLLFRTGFHPERSSMTFVPCLIQADVIRKLVSAYGDSLIVTGSNRRAV